MQDREFEPFLRSEDDDDWDDRLPCEPGCGKDCLPHQCRDAMRFALGTLAEGLEAIATVQKLAQDQWGECATPDCTFEAEMQDKFSTAGKALGLAFSELLDGVLMWKSLPRNWAEGEYETALRGVKILKTLSIEALRQADARRAGSPDPRDPTLTPRSN